LEKAYVGYRWVILFMVILASILAFLNVTGFSVLSSYIIPDMTIGVAQFGFFMTAYLVGIALASTPAGAIADRIGAKKTISLGIFLYSIGSILFSYSTNYWLALISRFLVGVGCAFYWAPPPRLFMAWNKPSEMPLCTALWFGALSIGSGTGFLVGPILAAALGWRTTYLIYGVIGILVGLLFFATVKDAPTATDGGEPIKPVIVRLSSGRGTSTASAGKSWITYQVIISSVVFFISIGLYYSALGLVPTFLSTYMTAGTLTADEVTTLNTVFGYVGLLGALLFGLLSVKTRKTPWVLVGAISLLAIAAAGLAGPNFVLLLVLLFIGGMGPMAVGVPLFAVVPTWVPQEKIATAIGFVSSMGFVGGIILTLGIPIVAELMGFTTVFMLYAALAVIAIISVLVLMRTEK